MVVVEGVASKQDLNPKLKFRGSLRHLFLPQKGGQHTLEIYGNRSYSRLLTLGKLALEYVQFSVCWIDRLKCSIYSKNLHSLKLTKHLKIGHSKRKLVFQPSFFRCELLVSGRMTWLEIHLAFNACNTI